MIRENVLDYFQEGHEEMFRWFRGIRSSHRLVDHRLTFRPVTIGSLKLPTGRLVASDPLALLYEKPFVRRVAKGSYNVVLSVAKIEYRHERVDWKFERIAFAMLKFTEIIPVRWELALREGDGAAASERNFFGYGVETGTGCFMDLATEAILNDLLEDREYGFFDFLCRQMEKNDMRSWEWIDYDFEGLPNNNLIAFTSGGDGRYASYFGLDAHDQPTCLVTDFELVKDSEKEETL